MKKGQSYGAIILLVIVVIALVVISVRLFAPSLSGKVIAENMNNEQLKEENVQQQPDHIPIIISESKPINYYENYDTIEGRNIVTICEKPCPINNDLLLIKHNGMESAMEKLISVIGEPPNKPIYVHLNGDSDCGTAEDMNKSHGFITGFSKLGKDGKPMICTFDYEKENRMLKFNKENAIKIEDQLLFVHEIIHGYFENTEVSYKIQENFCKAISFHISKYWYGNEFKPVTTACRDEGDFAEINKKLCNDFGFDFKDYDYLFLKIKEKVDSSNIVDDDGVIEIISDYVGRDVGSAFAKSQYE